MKILRDYFKKQQKRNALQSLKKQAMEELQVLHERERAQLVATLTRRNELEHAVVASEAALTKAREENGTSEEMKVLEEILSTTQTQLNFIKEEAAKAKADFEAKQEQVRKKLWEQMQQKAGN